MKVTLRLSALTRVEFSKEVEVPDDTTDSQLESMVDDLYESTDGGEYTEDNEYWEKGSCYFTKND